LIAVALSAPLALADDPDDAGPTRTLGTVTVTAPRASSLPTRIPTTIEGITGEDVARTINATYRLGERWTASLGVDNLGDEKYRAFHPYTQRTITAEVGANF
jgi:hypothetical protein